MTKLEELKAARDAAEATLDATARAAYQAELKLEELKAARDAAVDAALVELERQKENSND